MTSEVARINGIALNTAEEHLTPQELRQRACTELLEDAGFLLVPSRAIP